ncbi:hypothetical protein SAMN03159444_02154 [Pseudomonas sp. NFACC02]|uniref:toxin VasX n=1 Tax=Pseudomonas sp. NFACC02 TaxID=1566250 RepID=UPI0008BC15F8|nr:toxin VasX [Pseudomonas sp. NFACC02]SEQ64964.1 hypothetical protein SAMN03159444_02154 [Pseudomonas sp. NFACC02]
MTTSTRTNISANTVAMTKSVKDARSPVGLCPLMGKKLQLLPLRYGLVEHLDPRAEHQMPLTLESQPLGLRLLRDGYLYIIDNDTGYLHEYAIEQGAISKLLWSSNEVANDQRTSSVGEPHLIFARQHTLYASYSEIQWTARKCSQVLKSEGERQRLMQRIDLGSACASKGGPHLLARRQAQKWLAEVAEPDAVASAHEASIRALPEGVNPQETRPYHWEDPPLFQNTAIEALTSNVLGPYQNDYLFLVLRDDFGVMRDLANAQLQIADWIGQWSADESGQRHYLTGAYIQSMYAVDEAHLQTASATDPAIKRLLDETSAEQRDSIYEYLRVRRDQPGNAMYGSQAHWREAARTDPYARAFVDMVDALGDARYQTHSDTITALSLQTWEALHGKQIGVRGVDHLVQRTAMQTFVSQQQRLLNHWHQRLERVRNDRLKMITAGHFHRAAWYYDFQSDVQVRHRLETEFVCVAALCWNREATEKLAAFLDANLLTVVPGLETLTLDDQLDVAKKLADLSSFSIKAMTAQETAVSVNALANQFNSLMRERLPNYDNLNQRFAGLQSLLDGAYDPAHQLRAASDLESAHNAFKSQQQISPDNFIRNIGPPVRLKMLRAFSRHGLTLRAASAQEIEAFTHARDNALYLRTQLKAAYKLRSNALLGQIYGLEPQGSEVAHNKRINQLKTALEPIEETLTRALTVGSTGPGQIGTVVEGLSSQLRDEMQKTVRDYRATGTFRQPFNSAFKSAGDGLALVLFLFHAQKFVEVFTTLDRKASKSSEHWSLFENFIVMSSAGFAAIQGLSVTIFQAHIERMESAAGKLNSMSRLGRWAAYSGFGAFLFGGLAAAIDGGKHSRQWGRAFAQGDYKGLGAASLQIAGDGILLGTNTWGFVHTSSIISSVLKNPVELRALAWAEASPRLLSIAARANVIGLIGTALQLLGEGLYNYFNLDELQQWLHTSAWGTNAQPGTLQDDWSRLASVVQKPTCTLIRDAQRTYLKLVLPGVRTLEMDRRRLGLRVYQQTRDRYQTGPYNPRLPPRYWRESSAAWAACALVASTDEHALTLHLPIPKALQTSDFALAFTVAYQLEAHRELFHRTSFVLDDLRIATVQYARIPTIGTFEIDAVDTLPCGEDTDAFWHFTRDEMALDDAV